MASRYRRSSVFVETSSQFVSLLVRRPMRWLASGWHFEWHRYEPIEALAFVQLGQFLFDNLEDRNCPSSLPHALLWVDRDP